MKRFYSAFSVFVLFFLLTGVCQAITLTAPQTAQVGQAVTITVSGTPTGAQSTGCVITLDFGERTGTVSTTDCIGPGSPCGLTVSHVYQKAGTFTIRAFSSGTCSAGAFVNDPVVKTIQVVDFIIKRLDLYFNNRQPKITVDQYDRGLKASVDIRYTGSGLLHGQWEIDGRLFSKVRKQLYRGRQTVTIETPLAPPIPTHALGTHRVRFVVTRPSLTIDFPQALYFVAASPEGPEPTIALVTPLDRQTMVCEDATFRWEQVEGVYAYLLEFLEEGSEDPAFGAYVKKSTYTLKAGVCRSLFPAGHPYRWRVKAFDEQGRIIAVSQEWNLRFNGTP